jgi:hypothetical protein
MSTKIYDAFKVENGGMAYINELKKTLIDLYVSHVLRLVHGSGKYMAEEWNFPTWIFQRYLENRIFIEKEIKYLPGYALIDFLEAMIEWNKRDRFNVSMSMVVYEHQDDLYLHFFGIEDCPAMVNVIANTVKNGYLSDFHYQNHTDRPDGISEKDWDNREKVWDDIFGICNTPAQSGFVYDFWTNKINIFTKHEDWRQERKDRGEPY